MRKSISVFGRVIKIKYVANLKHPDTGQTVCGMFYPDRYLIEINKNQSKDEIERTLLHEVNHAIMHRIGLWQTNLTSDQHELICEGFSNFMFENMRFK